MKELEVAMRSKIGDEFEFWKHLYISNAFQQIKLYSFLTPLSPIQRTHVLRKLLEKRDQSNLGYVERIAITSFLSGIHFHCTK